MQNHQKHLFRNVDMKKIMENKIVLALNEAKTSHCRTCLQHFPLKKMFWAVLLQKE